MKREKPVTVSPANDCDAQSSLFDGFCTSEENKEVAVYRHRNESEMSVPCGGRRH